MFNSYMRVLSALILFSLISTKAFAADGGPLLKGKLSVSEPSEVTIVYDYDGDNYVETVTTSPDGTFAIDCTLPVDAVEALVYVGGQPFGAYLKNGSTTVMNIDGRSVAFSGDNVAENKFINAYMQAFYPMNYKPSHDVPFVFADYLDKLNSERDKAKAFLPAISEPARSRYSAMTDSYYNQVLLMLLSMDNSDEHKAQAEAIIAGIDPNSDISRLTGTLNYWYNSSDIHRSMKGNTVRDYIINQFAAVDSVLTNEANKKSIWNSLGSMYMMVDRPSDDDVRDFLAAVEPQLSRAPKIREHLLKVYESMKPKVNNGDAVPTDPILIAPDGSKCKLSELLGKTVVYIDIWATWCGPCCREIPHMDKLVERFKGNDAITFVSISRDDNRQAWLKKLERDNPAWPQYIFDKSSGDEFMNAMSISGIPRFLLIGKDGKFIAIDAARPSNADIDTILNDAISNK